MFGRRGERNTNFLNIFACRGNDGKEVLDLGAGRPCAIKERGFDFREDKWWGVSRKYMRGMNRRWGCFTPVSWEGIRRHPLFLARREQGRAPAHRQLVPRFWEEQGGCRMLPTSADCRRMLIQGDTCGADTVRALPALPKETLCSEDFSIWRLPSPSVCCMWCLTWERATRSGIITAWMLVWVCICLCKDGIQLSQRVKAFGRNELELLKK